MDKPQLVATVKAETQERVARQRQRTKRVLVVVASAVALGLAGVATGLIFSLIPDFEQPSVGSGDQPRVSEECGGANEAGYCLDNDHWELPHVGSRIETRYDGVRLKGQSEKVRVVVQATGCGVASEVRWKIIVDGSTVAAGVAGQSESTALGKITSGKGFTFVGERLNGGDCKIDLRLKPLVVFGIFT